jgi:hypothetical protein
MRPSSYKGQRSTSVRPSARPHARCALGREPEKGEVSVPAAENETKKNCRAKDMTVDQSWTKAGNQITEPAHPHG